MGTGRERARRTEPDAARETPGAGRSGRGGDAATRTERGRGGDDLALPGGNANRSVGAEDAEGSGGGGLIAGFDFRADGGGEALEFGVVEEGGGGIIAKEV